MDLQEHIELKLTVFGGLVLISPLMVSFMSGRCLKVSFSVWIVSECICGCLKPKTAILHPKFKHIDGGFSPNISI